MESMKDSTQQDAYKPMHKNSAGLKQAWLDELAIELTEKVWDECLKSTHDCLVNVRHRLIQFKTIHRLLYSKEKLHSFYPEVSLVCNRCKSENSNLSHSFWSGCKLYADWKSIFHGFSEAFGKRWELDPLIAILGAASSLSSANMYEKVAVLFGMVIAKLILQMWNMDSVPTYDQRLRELANTLHLERLRLCNEARGDIIARIWGPVLDFLTGVVVFGGDNGSIGSFKSKASGRNDPLAPGSSPTNLSAGTSICDQSVLPQSSSFVLQPNPCPTNFNNNVSSSVSQNQNVIILRASISNSTTNTSTIRQDMTTSNSPSGPTPPVNVLSHSHSLTSSGQRHIIPETSNNIVSNVAMGRLMGSRIGLALFGICSGNRALFKSIQEESGCSLLYIVEDCIQDVECAFSADVLANTRVVRGQDAGIVLNDQCVSGVIISSLAEGGSEVVLDALRAGKGVFCEKFLSLDKHVAESWFDEAARVGKPLVCGLYKRFDPAVQFLYEQVHNKALGRVQRIVSVSKTYPSPSLSYIKKTGGIFYDGVVHDLDTVCWLLGESAPDTVFSLGHAFCQEVAALKDADAVSVSMKFASGAIVTLDVSQHCTRNSEQRLEVHGSEGTLKMDNQNALGITGQGTPRLVCSQLQNERYMNAYRELLKHFLRTLKGKEQPFITKENFLWTIQVAAAAEQSWRNGSAVDLQSEPLDGTVIKIEVP